VALCPVHAIQVARVVCF